jgi:hypothetical protein
MGVSACEYALKFDQERWSILDAGLHRFDGGGRRLAD